MAGLPINIHIMMTIWIGVKRWGRPIKFGIWIEPEMVNPKSGLGVREPTDQNLFQKPVEYFGLTKSRKCVDHGVWRSG